MCVCNTAWDFMSGETLRPIVSTTGSYASCTLAQLIKGISNFDCFLNQVNGLRLLACYRYVMKPCDMLEAIPHVHWLNKYETSFSNLSFYHYWIKMLIIIWKDIHLHHICMDWLRDAIFGVHKHLWYVVLPLLQTSDSQKGYFGLYLSWG